MDKLNLNSSGIANTSNPFNTDLPALKGVFNQCQGQTYSMIYFYKCVILPSLLTSWQASTQPFFINLEKYIDDTKDAGKCMASMCLIKIASPQHFSHIWN